MSLQQPCTEQQLSVIPGGLTPPDLLCDAFYLLSMTAGALSVCSLLYSLGVEECLVKTDSTPAEYIMAESSSISSFPSNIDISQPWDLGEVFPPLDIRMEQREDLTGLEAPSSCHQSLAQRGIFPSPGQTVQVVGGSGLGRWPKLVWLR